MEKECKNLEFGRKVNKPWEPSGLLCWTECPNHLPHSSDMFSRRLKCVVCIVSFGYCWHSVQLNSILKRNCVVREGRESSHRATRKLGKGKDRQHRKWPRATANYHLAHKSSLSIKVVSGRSRPMQVAARLSRIIGCLAFLKVTSLIWKSFWFACACAVPWHVQG
jgi:hypothetical protein